MPDRKSRTLGHVSELDIQIRGTRYAKGKAMRCQIGPKNYWTHCGSALRVKKPAKQGCTSDSCACASACVCERERERKRESARARVCEREIVCVGVRERERVCVCV